VSDYYRCETGADCPHAGEPYFAIENLETWECPIKRRDCKERLRPISWSERHRRQIRFGVIGLITVVLLAIILLLRPDVLLNHAQQFVRDCKQLEIESPPVLPADVATTVDKLGEEVTELNSSAPDAPKRAADLEEKVRAALQHVTTLAQSIAPARLDQFNGRVDELNRSGDDLAKQAEKKKHLAAKALIREGQSLLQQVLARLTHLRDDAAVVAATSDKLNELQSALERKKSENIPTKLRIVAQPALARRLVAPLLESFAREHWPAAKIDRRELPGKDEWRVVVTDSGQSFDLASATAGQNELFVTLARHGADIVVTACKPNSSDLDAMRDIGDMNSPSCAQVIALDGVAVLVHPSSSRTNISAQEIEQLLAGKEILGASTVIVPGPNADDGDVLCELVRLAPQAGTSSAVNQRVSDVVIASPAGIGFGAYSVPSRATLVSVQAAPDAAPLKPSPFTIATEDYKLSLRIIAYHAMKPAKELTHEFVAYVTSPQGQNEVGRIGFVDQNLKTFAAPLSDERLVRMAKALGVSQIKNAQRLSTDLRFATAKFELDLKGIADIDRLVRKLAEPDLRDKSVVLAGFADKRGGDKINVPLSDNRAEFVRNELQQYKVGGGRQLAAVGFSSAYPVDSRDTEEGLQRNRRVEVWVVDIVR
jgi:phosphate transport system substrate-binding protein